MNKERSEVSKSKCPKWEKKEPLNRFVNNLALWDKIQSHKGKYLDLMESLSNSERKIEKERIEMEILNNNMNPEDPDIIKQIIVKLQEWFGRPKIDDASVSWRIIKDIQIKEGKSVESYITRFDSANSSLKCSTTELPPDILAIILLDGLKVDTVQRQNIVSKIKFENNPSVLEDLKRAFKLLKGPVVENGENTQDSEVNYHDNKYYQ